MLLKKQKVVSHRNAITLGIYRYTKILEYRAQIAPVQFTIKELEMYGCLSASEIQNMENTTIEEHKLRQLVVDGLKLSFVYDPLRQSLEREWQRPQSHFPLRTILRILFRGEFYRFINNHQNQLKILINNRTTQANVNILMSALLVYASKKFTIQDISTALLFFTLQAALQDSQQITVPFDPPRIIKILKKIERVIKPFEFKTWTETLRNSKDFRGQIEAHHFLFLCNLTERKFTHFFGSLTLKPKIQNLFKNLNINLKITDFEQKQIANDGVEQRRIIRGLSFSEARPSKSTFSKEILKQFRLRDPSKQKRPDTALLRRHVSTFVPGTSLDKYMTQNTLKLNNMKVANENLSKITTQIAKVGLNRCQKAELRLKLTKKQRTPKIV